MMFPLEHSACKLITHTHESLNQRRSSHQINEKQLNRNDDLKYRSSEITPQRLQRQTNFKQRNALSFDEATDNARPLIT